MSTHRVALISDIHANEVALRAVLDDIDRVGVDLIACLGDVATLGPRPREVLALLRERCATFILGNHDEYMFSPDLIHHHSRDPAVLETVAWGRDQLLPEDISFVETFAPTVKLSLGDAGDLFLFHGSPASNIFDILSETPDTKLSELLNGHHAAVMAAGHTHIQMVRQHRGTLVVNPGSVGLPFERYAAGGPPTIMGYAEYGIVEATNRDVAVGLRRVALDHDALLAEARAWQAPLAEYLVSQYEARSA